MSDDVRKKTCTACGGSGKENPFDKCRECDGHGYTWEHKCDGCNRWPEDCTCEPTTGLEGDYDDSGGLGGVNTGGGDNWGYRG